MDGHGDDRHVGTLGGRKGASEKPADAAGPIERALRKEYERRPAAASLHTRRASEPPL